MYMNTLYKSSSFMTYLQYVISPIVVGICLYGFYYYFTSGAGIEEMPAYYLPIMIWVCMVVIINIVKLRYIEVNENNIIIKTLSGEKVLDYKDIEWVNQNILGSNWYIVSLKYKDIESGKSKTIFIFPEMHTAKENTSFFANFGQELNITKYIREQIIKSNSAYQQSNEPSRWYLFKWVFLSIIPFLLASYFLI